MAGSVFILGEAAWVMCNIRPESMTQTIKHYVQRSGACVLASLKFPYIHVHVHYTSHVGLFFKDFFSESMKSLIDR